MGYSPLTKNLFIPNNISTNKPELQSIDKYLTIHFERFLLDQHVASVYSARKTNTRIIKSYRRREGSRKFTNGGGENSEDHGVRISRYLYSKNRIHRTERKELKIGLPDREIAHGFGSLAIYEQRFSVFSAG